MPRAAQCWVAPGRTPFPRRVGGDMRHSPAPRAAPHCGGGVMVSGQGVGTQGHLWLQQRWESIFPGHRLREAPGRAELCLVTLETTAAGDGETTAEADTAYLRGTCKGETVLVRGASTLEGSSGAGAGP